MPLLRNRSTFKEITMGYFESNGWRQDYNNLLKSLLLISKKLEDLTNEVRVLRETSSVDPHKENKSTD